MKKTDAAVRPAAPTAPAAQRWLAATLAAVLAGAALLPPPAFAQAAPRSRSPQPVTLNFVNAEIEAVTRAMAAILNQQFIVDPRVKGAMTLYSDVPLTPRQAYLNYLAALRGLGFTVVEVGGLFKVVPEADAKLQSGTVSIGETSRRGDQILTQVFKLNHESANNLVPVLRPLISPNNTINANPGNNSLVITDYADNLSRIAKIIAAMDTPSSGGVEVITLRHAVASDIAALVQRATEGGAATQPGIPGGAGAAASVLIDARSNSLLVRAPNPVRMAAIRELVAKLDTPIASAGAAGNVWVVYLKNADAVKLASVLRAAYGGGAGAAGATGAPTAPTPIGIAAGPGGGASPQATTPVGASPSPSTGGFIQADPATNALIITAPEPLYRQLRAAIDQLDSRRAQVYVESLIVEVDATRAADFGIQWQGLLGSKGDTNIIGAGTNFGGGTNNILNATKAIIGGTTGLGAAALPGPGFNIGLAHKFGEFYTLGALARALDTTTGVNILSTPNLVTLDNEEAKIVVGQNVPFITGQYANTGTAITSPFQTIERKDVGITLRIRPQIGENGAVRMTIFQESSSVATIAAVGTDTAGPTTNKRSIESTIVVDDGQIIVLGGLIEDTYDSSRSKVPVLGDLPYVGALFRSESRTRRKTNLMVFLRPVVMRDQPSATRLSLDRYDYIRAEQQNNQPPPSSILRINESPVLPPLRPEATDAPRPLGDVAPAPPVVVPSQPSQPAGEPARSN